MYNAQQSRIFQEKIDQYDESPEIFLAFWKDWHQLSKEHSTNFYKLLQLLEQYLFQSSDMLLTHPLSSPLCQALRFWQLQIQRNHLKKRIYSPKKQNNHDVNLNTILQTWELFQNSFIPRLPGQYRKILTKAMAMPYSFAGLAIIQTINQETSQHRSLTSLRTIVDSTINDSAISGEFGIEHYWTMALLTAKFQKTVGYLAQAEKILKMLLTNLQQNSAIFSSAMFELCDIYVQMEQNSLFHQNVRKLLLLDPLHWDFTLVGSQFCQQLLQKLPYNIRSQFSNNDDPVALNWAGLCALADGKYDLGNTLNHQQQKTYWDQILQLKKTISSQKIATKQHKKHELRNNEINPTASNNYENTANGFYSLQRAQLLIYYILILEHLALIRNSENSNQVLEENSALWHNVLIEIYSLSEDIFLRCKNRFS